MPGIKFIHNLLTRYHCQPYYKKYKCKKPISDKKRNECEQESEQFERKDICPEYKLCKTKHWLYCEKEKCENGCMLNKCNNIICLSCKEKNINCKRFFLII